MKRKILLFTLLFLFSLLYLTAQDFTGIARNQGTEQGLPPYPPRVLYAAEDGRLWIGTEKGLFLMRGGEVVPVYYGNEAFNAYITAIVPEKNEKLWIGTQEGIYVYSLKSELLQCPDLRDHHNRPLKAYFQPLGFDPEGCLWIYTGYNQASLYRYCPAENRVYQMGRGYNGFREVNWSDGKKELWYAENRGAFRLRFSGRQAEERAFFHLGEQALEVSDVLLNGTTVYFATSAGVWQSQNEEEPRPLFARDSYIHQMALRNGYLYCATTGKGIRIWNIARGREEPAFRHAEENMFTPADNDIRLVHIRNNILYYAGSNGYAGSISLSRNPLGIRPAAELSPSSAFTAYKRKLYFLDGRGRLFSYMHPDSVQGISGLPDGLQALGLSGEALWAADNQVLYRIYEDHSESFAIPPQAYRTRINVIMTDPQDRPLLLSDRGIYLLKNGKVVPLEGLSNETYTHYTHAVFDGDGRLYIHAHYSFFLYGRYENGVFHREGLSEFPHEIKTLLPHPSGYGILAFTPDGVYRFTGAQKSAELLFSFHKRPLWHAYAGKARALYLQDQRALTYIPDIRKPFARELVPLPASAVRPGAAVRIPGSRSWLLPDLRSWWYIHPGERRPNVRIHISEAGNLSGNPIRKLEPDPNRNFIHLHAGLQSSLPAREVQLRYYLNGDRGSMRVLPGESGEIYFERLPPGNYTLHVEARLFDLYTIASEKVDIYIRPAWYDSPSFLLFCILIAISLAGLIIQGIIRTIRRREQLRRRIQETENLALRSQMNPHFIFNTLNSINSLVLDNKTDEASLYIRKFSRLIRNTLDLTRKESVSLQDDIENLELYIQLESERTGHRFRRELYIDPELDISHTEIPPLLVQPFVENAIWHGLINRPAGGGTLRIRYERKNDHTLCIHIEDDGIGREEARKRAASRKHTSHGLSIVKERLELADPGNFFIFTDIKNAAGEAAGTHVQIYLNVKC